MGIEQILEILNEIDDTIDYEKEKALIDGHVLESFDIVSLVGELCDAFDIEISPAELVPENFNSAEAIWKMVQSLQ